MFLAFQKIDPLIRTFTFLEEELFAVSGYGVLCYSKLSTMRTSCQEDILSLRTFFD